MGMRVIICINEDTVDQIGAKASPNKTAPQTEGDFDEE